MSTDPRHSEQMQDEAIAEVFDLDTLCTLSALPRRTVRYYIQIGLLDRPEGEKRGAYYLRRHLDQLLRIRDLSRGGLSLERIREVLHGGGADTAAAKLPRARQPGDVVVRSHVWLAPGIELQVSPEQAGLSPEQLRQLIHAVTQAYEHIKESSDD